MCQKIENTFTGRVLTGRLKSDSQQILSSIFYFLGNVKKKVYSCYCIGVLQPLDTFQVISGAVS